MNTSMSSFGFVRRAICSTYIHSRSILLGTSLCCIAGCTAAGKYGMRPGDEEKEKKSTINSSYAGNKEDKKGSSSGLDNSNKSNSEKLNRSLNTSMVVLYRDHLFNRCEELVDPKDLSYFLHD